MTPTEEFITSFHSITGTTIGERRKNLFLLLNKTQDHSIDLTCLQPKTPLEETFKVEALIYFKKVPDLIDVLKSENVILIKKVLKVEWFLERALESISGEELVKQIFPSLSFNAKVKTINKLAVYLKNTEQADAIFKATREKYGLYLAAKLLPCCSGKIILDSIKLARVELTPRQLLIIIKKHPELTESILESLSQFQTKSVLQDKYKNIFIHVLQNDLLMFLKLYKEYKPSFRLGWRATDRLVLGNKQNVIKNAGQFYKLLHRKQILKSVSEDFTEFYYDMFPKSLGRFKDDYNFYLELIPKNLNRTAVLSSTFRKKYECEIWDDPACVTPGFLELMSPDLREAWMQTHPRPNGLAEDIWICLMKPDKSIPALKKRISLVSNIKERAELIGCLVETCRINDDKVALLDVCKYVITQHRNDNSSVLRCFLNTLKNCFCLDELEEEHWKYINEVVQLFILRKTIPYYYFEWLSAYVQFRLVKNLPIKEHLKDMATKMMGNFYNPTKCEKQYLITYGEVLPELYKEDDLQNQHVQFLHAIVKWNKKHPNDSISLLAYQHSLDALQEVMKKEDCYAYTYMAEIVIAYCIRLKTPQIENFLTLYFNKKNLCIEMTTLEWLIKYEPTIVLTYIDSITNSILGLWYTLIKPFFWMHCKNYTHLEIPQKITVFCLNILSNEEESDSRKKNAITALSYLMEPDVFLNLITPYYPSDLIMDVNSEENPTYKIQQAITGCLKNIIPPSSMLESVLNFSKGDYLKFIQRSLHSVSHSVPEEKIVSLFAALVDRPVSVRKHSIYLTFKVLDKMEIHKMLSKLMMTEKNSTIRKILFKGTFNYFIKNPDDYLWDLVKQNIKSVDMNDKEAFDTLMEISKVPSEYLAQYFVFTWELLEALPHPEKYEEGKCQLLDAVSSKVIPSLSKEFCMGIIHKYLFKSKEKTNFQINLYSFTCKFLIFMEPEQEERAKFIFAILENYMNMSWNNPGSKSVGRNFMFGFLKEFCSYFIRKIYLDKKILVIFDELWNKLLKPHEAFEEYLYLQFTLIYVDFMRDNLSLGQIGEKLAKLCDSLLNLYGNTISSVFSDSLNSYIGHFLNDSDDLEANRFILIQGIISVSSSRNCLIMAVALLPQDVPTTPKIKIIYDKIINMIEKNSDPVVQLSLCCYFDGVAKQNRIVFPEREKTKRSFGGIRGMRLGHMAYIEEYSSKYQK